MTSDMFFESWSAIGRVLAVGSLAYAALVILLRTSGKRTLSKLNAFDLVVTVALGSTLATVLLSKDVALAEGVVALALLITLQFVIAWMSVRSSGFEDVIKSEPTLLMRNGRFLESAMRRQRITRTEVLAAVRARGHAGIDRVAAVVLESNGTISVIERAGGEPLQVGETDALAGVAEPKKAERTEAARSKAPLTSVGRHQRGCAEAPGPRH